MIKDDFGQCIYTENDILGIIMQGVELHSTILATNISKKDIEEINKIGSRITISDYVMPALSVAEFDIKNQNNWYMPDDYKKLDIAEYILSLCDTQEELQRCGNELLMYQDRNLFNLLRYMKYLVDTMKLNNVIWGVGRGSSVASYILFKLEVHKVNSMFYKLDVDEFLR